MCFYTVMKTIIIAPKDYTDYKKMGQVVNSSPFKPTDAILSTGEAPCRVMWEKYAGQNDIKLVRADAPNWKEYGNKAEYLRNQQLLHQADALIAFYDNINTKTRRFIEHALSASVPVDIAYITIPTAEATDGLESRLIPHISLG
jgi:hypothetical protein